MSWWEFVPQVLVAVGVLFLPGLAFAAAVRMPMGSAIFAAPLFSVGSIAIGAVILPLVGMRWSLGTFAVFHAAVVIAVGVITSIAHRHWPHRRLRTSSRGRRTLLAGFAGSAFAAIIISAQLAIVFGNPTSISQSYDNIFHLNAIRYIADEGDGSSLTLNSLATTLPGINFYPAAWHDAAALIVSLFPTSIPASVNALTVAVAAFAWPAGMTFLATTLWPGSRLIVFATGALSSVCVAFPGLMLKWGILYPNMLGYALLPAFIGLVVVWGRAVIAQRTMQIVAGTLLVAFGALALALAHPNSITSAAVLATPFLIAELWRSRRRSTSHRPPAFRVRIAALVAAILICVASWALLRPPESASTWPEKLPSGQAAGEFLTNSFNGNSAAVGLSALTFMGLYVVLHRRRQLWLPVSWALTGLLWVVVASLHPGALRTLLTGAWYNDSFRLAALTAVPTVLLAAMGLMGTIAVAQRLAQTLARRPLSTRVSASITAATSVLLLAALTLAPSLRASVDSVAREFRETADSLLLTSDEQRVLDRVEELVPIDDVIAINPWDGSALVYALDDREVTQYHTLGATDESFEAIPRSLNEAVPGSEVCRQIEEGGVRWYLGFEDTLGIGEWAKPLFSGFEGVIESGVLRAAYVSGDVGLYEIVGCE